MRKSVGLSLVVSCFIPQICQAQSYLNLFEINCLPEVGVLQIAPRPYPLHESELQKLYDNEARLKQSWEDKNFYLLKLNTASSIQKICHFKGYNVQADLQTVVCENKNAQVDSKPCFDTSLNLKVGDKEIVARQKCRFCGFTQNQRTRQVAAKADVIFQNVRIAP